MNELGQEDDMNLDRFKQILDSYGANPDRWPSDERAAAEDLLGRSAEARDLVAEYAALDSILDVLPAGEVSQSLKEAVLASAATELSAAAIKDANVLSGDNVAQGFWSRLGLGTRGLLADLDSLQWSGSTLFKSAPALGCAAALGFLVAIYGPVAVDDVAFTSSEDAILVAAFGSPDYGMDDFSFNGVME